MIHQTLSLAFVKKISLSINRFYLLFQQNYKNISNHLKIRSPFLSLRRQIKLTFWKRCCWIFNWKLFDVSFNDWKKYSFISSTFLTSHSFIDYFSKKIFNMPFLSPAIKVSTSTIQLNSLSVFIYLIRFFVLILNQILTIQMMKLHSKFVRKFSNVDRFLLQWCQGKLSNL